MNDFLFILVLINTVVLTIRLLQDHKYDKKIKHFVCTEADYIREISYLTGQVEDLSTNLREINNGKEEETTTSKGCNKNPHS